MTTMYGIANCDTIKKAKNWLNDNSIVFDFHDYKKAGVNEAVLKDAIQRFGIDAVVNKRGTTYRKLDENTKANINEDNVVALLSENASMIKRPLLVHENEMLLGFKADAYEEFFKGV